MRLIDADALISAINQSTCNWAEHLWKQVVCDVINNQPTAFDTEKVVEQLDCNSRFIDDINEHNIKCISCVIGQKTAIDIVKKGGV
jgi:hypothetical protein